MLKRTTFLCCALMFFLLPSSALATHVQCGDVITQDTTLDSDLIDCPGDGVVIGAGNITLDLAGHTIDGTGQGAGGHGVDNAGADNVAVVNGRIQQFQNAVSIVLSDANVLTGLDLADSGSGVYLEEASLTQVLGNDIRSSGAGVTLFREGNFNVIRSNSLSANGTAVFVAGFSPSERPEQTEIADNDVFGNTTGIFVGISLRTEVRGNRVVDNSEDGIFEGAGASSSLIEGNVSSRNGFSGIATFNSNDSVVTGNRTWDNGSDGVLVGSSARRAVISDNFSKGNGDDGIDVDAAGTTVARNKANVNADLGIEAVPGVIDGGGNKAHGNGNRAQCINVSCK
jgi:nitrous oxidase accessory protein NosD